MLSTERAMRRVNDIGFKMGLSERKMAAYEKLVMGLKARETRPCHGRDCEEFAQMVISGGMYPCLSMEVS